MVRFRDRLQLAVLLFLQLGCSSRSISTHNLSIVAQTRNAKYHLTCIFYGGQVELENGRTVEQIRSVSLRDQRSGAEAAYEPEDTESLSNSEGFFTDVWSPDGEWLVLPLGRFEGYRLIRSSEALNELQANRSSEFLRIELKNNVHLWHHFDGWKGPSSFFFDAGLSDRQFKFLFSIPDRSLRPMENISSEFVAATAEGNAVILPVK
jgi:hypothetical protein